MPLTFSTHVVKHFENKLDYFDVGHNSSPTFTKVVNQFYTCGQWQYNALVNLRC